MTSLYSESTMPLRRRSRQSTTSLNSTNQLVLQQRYYIWESWHNRDDDSLYQITVTAPPPAKDFVQIYLSADEVILRKWSIVPPNRTHPTSNIPTEVRILYDDFEFDELNRALISRTFGEKELSYIDGLIAGHIDFLNRLPRKLLVKILMYLNITSLTKIARVSRKFKELASCDAVWSALYMQYSSQPISHRMLMTVESYGSDGWKKMFRDSGIIKKNVARFDDNSVSGVNVSVASGRKGSKYSRKISLKGGPNALL